MPTKQEIIAELQRRGELPSTNGAPTQNPASLQGGTAAPAAPRRMSSQEVLDEQYAITDEDRRNAGMKAVGNVLTAASLIPVAGAGLGAARALTKGTRAALSRGASKVQGPTKKAPDAPVYGRAERYDTVEDIAKRYPGPAQTAPFSRLKSAQSSAAGAARGAASSGVIKSTVADAATGAGVGAIGSAATGDIDNMIDGALAGAAGGRLARSVGTPRLMKKMMESPEAKLFTNSPLGRFILSRIAKQAGVSGEKSVALWYALHPTSRKSIKAASESFLGRFGSAASGAAGAATGVTGVIPNA